MNRFANALSLLASRNNFICQRLAASSLEYLLLEQKLLWSSWSDHDAALWRNWIADTEAIPWVCRKNAAIAWVTSTSTTWMENCW